MKLVIDYFNKMFILDIVIIGESPISLYLISFKVIIISYYFVIYFHYCIVLALSKAIMQFLHNLNCIIALLSWNELIVYQLSIFALGDGKTNKLSPKCLFNL